MLHFNNTCCIIGIPIKHKKNLISLEELQNKYYNVDIQNSKTFAKYGIPEKIKLINQKKKQKSRAEMQSPQHVTRPLE